MTSTNIASPGIQATSITKSYGTVQAVRGVDISISRGQTVALLGPNGAGKSTTIDMLLGLAKPDSGTVSIFGKSPSEAVHDGLIGGMLQTGSLIQYLTVRELVHLVACLYPHPLPLDEVFAMTGLTDIASRSTSKLSGGQTQRVRFAMGLVGDPELLVLDEPTAAIDIEGRHEFWNAMRSVAAQGKTVLFATHYLEEADNFADRIIVMARGKIVADGPPTEVKARVAARTVRATAPDLGMDSLTKLPGVTQAQRHGDQIVLTCSDADAALYALLGASPSIKDIEVRGAGLEEAFLELTAEDDEENLA